MPSIEYWFKGTNWAGALAFVLAIISAIDEPIYSYSGTIHWGRVILSVLLPISVFFSWWASAVHETKGRRHITGHQRSKINKHIKKSQLELNTTINVATNLMESEAREYAQEFVELFIELGLQSELNQSINPVGNLRGLYIATRPNLQSDGKLLKDIMLNSGIKVDLYTLAPEQFPEHQFVLAVGSPSGR